MRALSFWRWRLQRQRRPLAIIFFLVTLAFIVGAIPVSAWGYDWYLALTANHLNARDQTITELGYVPRLFCENIVVFNGDSIKTGDRATKHFVQVYIDIFHRIGWQDYIISWTEHKLETMDVNFYGNVLCSGKQSFRIAGRIEGIFFIHATDERPGMITSSCRLIHHNEVIASWYCGDYFHISSWCISAIFNGGGERPIRDGSFLHISSNNKGALDGSECLSRGIVGPAQRIPLEQCGEKSENTYSSYHSGPTDQTVSDRGEASSFPYKRIMLGILLIACGWAALWYSLALFDKASESTWYIAPAIVIGVIAVAIMGHGLFYACLGVWGLPSLYIL